MKTTKEVTRKKQEIVDVFCNKCGQSLYGGMNYNGLVEISVWGNYDSPVFPDGACYTFSLCEACLENLFKTFKHEPEFEDI